MKRIIWNIDYLALLCDFGIEKSDVVIELGHLFMSQRSEVRDRAQNQEQVTESSDTKVVRRHVQWDGNCGTLMHFTEDSCLRVQDMSFSAVPSLLHMMTR